MQETDWKLKLRYGKLNSPYKHFTVLGDGVARSVASDFSCPDGPVWMAMKVWAENTDQAADMLRVIGNDIGFEVKGRIEVYDTEPESPPEDNPFGYDIKFTLYTE